MAIRPKRPAPVPKPPGSGNMPKLPPKGGPQAPPDPGPVFKPHPGGGVQKPPKKRPGRP